MCTNPGSEQCGCGGNHESLTAPRRVLDLHQNVLTKNNEAAQQSRLLFQSLLAINIMSSPGSGKTSLIQTLIQTLLKEHQLPAGVIIGDLATELDAEKIRRTGAPAIQVNTGNLCHLEAISVAKAAQKLTISALEILIIENVGNLVCPAMYDLGEDLRIVLMSVTEGEDKPLKYPVMFKSADAVVISKLDLAAATRFDQDKAMACISQVTPHTPIFLVSTVSEEGIRDLCTYLARSLQQKKSGKLLEKTKASAF